MKPLTHDLADLNTVVAGPTIEYLLARYGEAETRRVVEAAGLDLETLLDHSKWIGFERFAALLEELVKATGDARAPYEAGLYAGKGSTWRMFHILYRHLRFSSPRFCYQLVARYSSRFSNIGRFRFISGKGNSVVIDSIIEATHVRQVPNNCLSIQGQLASIPTVFGGPPARVRHVDCQANGAPHCRYEIDWVVRPQQLTIGVGAACGVLAAAILWSFYPLPTSLWTLLGLVALPLLGLVAGLSLVNYQERAGALARLEWEKAHLLETNDQVRELNRLLTSQLSDLRAHHDELESILSAIGDPLVATDSEGKTHLANPAAREVLRLQEGEDHPLERLLAPAESDHWLRFHDRLTRTQVVSEPFSLCLPSNEVIPVLITASRSAETQRHVYVLRDLREQLREEEAKRLLTLRTQRAAKLASLGELAARVAHDLATPITSLQLTTSTLECLANAESDPDLRAQTLTVVDLFRSALTRINAILRGLLLYGRQQHREDATFDVHKAVEEVQELLGGRFKEATESLVRGDMGKLHQAVMNLTTNAIDAFDHTCTERLVLFHTYNKGPYLFLEVVDHGVGIEEDLLSQVSEPFFTTKELGKGTGLGLTIASELTAELGGELSFTSSRGSGSTFTIMLETFQSPEPATDTQMTA